MRVLSMILTIALVLLSGIFITLVLMQESKSAGISGIDGGTNESFFSKNKNASREEKLALYSKIAAGVFVVLSIALVLVQQYVVAV